MRFFTRSLIGLFLAAMTLGILALAGETLYQAVQTRMAGGGNGSPPATERMFAATVITATPGRIQPEMTVFGEVRSRRTLEIRSPRAGTVIWLADGVDEGAAVKAGQVLVRLDPADAIAARDLALSDRSKAEAERDEAGRALAITKDELAGADARAALQAQALARQQGLVDRGVGSAAARESAALAASSADQAVLAQRSALSQAETRLALAETALARQAITLSEAERAVQDTEIKAEFDGLLSDVAVVAGGVVAGNERLAQLIDPSALEVSFRLSTAQFARLMDAQGQLVPAPVTVSLDVSGAQITASGHLVRVAAAVGQGQTGRLVYAALDAAPGLRPGDFVTLVIQEPALEDVIVLPASALGVQGDVLVLGAEDRLEALPVTILRRQGDDILLRAPALEGREVVSERSPLLGTGIRVRPVRDGTASAKPEPELVELTQDRRAALIAFVEANQRMPADAKARVLAQLAQERVPADVVARLEQRIGG